MAKYYWIKLQKDFFNSLRIKKLRKLAGGDTYTIIYLKMQLLSLQDKGCLYYKGIGNSFVEEIALDIDESADNVQVTINYLMSCGLLQQHNKDTYSLPYVLEAIGCDSDEAVKMRQYRVDKKAQNMLEASKTEKLAKVVEIVDYLNAKAGTNYRASTKATQSLINARLDEKFTVEQFKAVIDKQCKKWKGTQFEEYLRPQTLFGTKFESYLNAQKSNSNDIDSTYDINDIEKKAMFAEEYDI